MSRTLIIPRLNPPREPYGPYVRNHPLGTIRDVPESTKQLTRNRSMFK